MGSFLSIIRLDVEGGHFPPDLERLRREVAEASGAEVGCVRSVPSPAAPGFFAYYPGIFPDDGMEIFGRANLEFLAPRMVVLSVQMGKIGRLLARFRFLAVVEENAVREWSGGRIGGGVGLSGFIGRTAILGPDHIAFELPAQGYAMAAGSALTLPQRLAAYLMKCREAGIEGV